MIFNDISRSVYTFYVLLKFLTDVFASDQICHMETGLLLSIYSAKLEREYQDLNNEIRTTQNDVLHLTKEVEDYAKSRVEMFIDSILEYETISEETHNCIQTAQRTMVLLNFDKSIKLCEERGLQKLQHVAKEVERRIDETNMGESTIFCTSRNMSIEDDNKNCLADAINTIESGLDSVKRHTKEFLIDIKEGTSNCMQNVITGIVNSLSVASEYFQICAGVDLTGKF